MTQAYDFPGGRVVLDPERVWRELQAWLAANPSRRCTAGYNATDGYTCRLSWDTVDSSGLASTVGAGAKSRLGLGDAVANALQAACIT